MLPLPEHGPRLLQMPAAPKCVGPPRAGCTVHTHSTASTHPIHVPSSALPPTTSPTPAPTPLAPLADVPLPRVLRPEGWVRWLDSHPDRNLVTAAVHGIRRGVPVLCKPMSGRITRYVLPSATEAEEAISRDIADEVAAGRMAGPYPLPPTSDFVCSPIGAVPKSNGKWRRTHHLSWPRSGVSVNSRIAHKLAKYQTVDDAVALVLRLGRGAELAKIDIRSAFRCVPVRPADRRLLGFYWRGGFYADLALPFGMRSSPPLWEVYGALAQWAAVNRAGVTSLVRYVDDYLLVGAAGTGDCLRQRTALLQLFAELGLPVSPEKLAAEGSPATSGTFLGVLFDTLRLTLSIPAVKREALKALLQDWCGRRKCTGKDLQSLVGKMAFVARIAPNARPYVRPFIDALVAAHACGKSGSRRVRLTQQLVSDLRWWLHFVSEWDGTAIMAAADAPSSVDVYTDASSSFGYGAYCDGEWISQPWSGDLRTIAQCAERESVPFFELSAILAAASAWGARWRGRRVLFNCDCAPVVAALNSRTTRSPRLLAALRALQLLAAQHDFTFASAHVPGSSNVYADRLSRGDVSGFRAVCAQAALLPTKVSPESILGSLRLANGSSVRDWLRPRVGPTRSDSAPTATSANGAAALHGPPLRDA